MKHMRKMLLIPNTHWIKRTWHAMWMMCVCTINNKQMVCDLMEVLVLAPMFPTHPASKTCVHILIQFLTHSFTPFHSHVKIYTLSSINGFNHLYFPSSSHAYINTLDHNLLVFSSDFVSMYLCHIGASLPKMAAHKYIDCGALFMVRHQDEIKTKFIKRKCAENEM